MTEPSENFDLLTSDGQEEKNVRIVSDEMAQMNWIRKADFIKASLCTNVVIAA